VPREQLEVGIVEEGARIGRTLARVDGVQIELHSEIGKWHPALRQVGVGAEDRLASC
jgi:hypothetical protein